MEYQYTYNENCWFKDNCPRENNIGCDSSCPIRSEFDYLINTSNIPDEFKKKKTLYPEKIDLEAFNTLKIHDNMKEFFAKENGFELLVIKYTDELDKVLANTFLK